MAAVLEGVSVTAPHLHGEICREEGGKEEGKGGREMGGKGNTRTDETEESCNGVGGLYVCVCGRLVCMCVWAASVCVWGGECCFNI